MCTLRTHSLNQKKHEYILVSKNYQKNSIIDILSAHTP